MIKANTSAKRQRKHTSAYIVAIQLLALISLDATRPRVTIPHSD